MQAMAHGMNRRVARHLLLAFALAGLALVAACAVEDPSSSEDETGERTAQLAEGKLAGPVVSIIKNGSGGGWVYSTPAAIDCSPTCSASVPVGTVLVLTAVPAASSSFGGWNGGGCTGTGTCTITVTGDVTIGANFQWNFYPLTVSKSGFGSGTVTSSPAGINCGTACSTQIRHGSFVSLTATAASGSLFTGWSGACTGTGTCGFTMTAAASVTAHFAPANPIVSVMKTGSGGGWVFSSPAAINCSPTCTAAVPYGTVLTLNASAVAPSSFAGWSLTSCPGTGPCTFTVTNDITIGARFTRTFPFSALAESAGEPY